MKTRIAIVSFVCLLALAAPVLSFGWGRAPSDAAVDKVSPEYVATRLGQPGVLVLDVRAPADWRESGTKIAGAVRRDPGAVAQWAKELPPDKELILYCA